MANFWALQAVNGKFVTTKREGQWWLLQATSDSVSRTEVFRFLPGSDNSQSWVEAYDPDHQDNGRNVIRNEGQLWATRDDEYPWFYL